MSGAHPPPTAGAGPSSGINMPSQPQGAGAPAAQNMSQQNLNQIVLEYLLKKGYTRTEMALRQESAQVDSQGRPHYDRSVDYSNEKYIKGFNLLSGWIDQNLDIYKAELRRLLWPIYVYSYLSMVMNRLTSDATTFLEKFRAQFERIHADELKTLETVTLPQHVLENPLTKLYRENKYRIPLAKTAFFTLMTFLEQNEATGGHVITVLIQTYCTVKDCDRGPVDQFSFEAIAGRVHGPSIDYMAELEEGIPGAFTGVNNLDMEDNKRPLRLGPMQMEMDLRQEVRTELEVEDARNPPHPGQASLVDTFDQNIKREESVDAIQRTDIPLPPSRARDVVMEVQKIKEYRDRFKIESRTGGIGPQVSVAMYTFHNTMDSLTCIEFSDDGNLVGAGTEESYIRVWNIHGAAIGSVMPGAASELPVASRRLVGHSGPVYNISFSPSIAGPQSESVNVPSTAPKTLLSSSSDKTVRLWSLETWSCLVVYKGHEGPVWSVRWGPFGHYFATCSLDKTVRVWTQDHISYVRMMVGHDTNVNQIAWHPNGSYVFSASDHADKTVRMWSLVTGACVRVFPGHTDFISALECAPNGKILASADGGGNIIMWDLEKGCQIKRCRGHGRGGIWSLSFSVESTVLASGGADGTVRIWDVNVPTDPYKNADGDGNVIGAGGQADATRITGAATVQVGAGVGVAGGSGGGKKKGKEITITPDQISAFPTKKSPVYKVKFTRMNMVMAGGCFLP